MSIFSKLFGSSNKPSKVEDVQESKYLQNETNQTGLPFHRIDRLSPFRGILFIFCSIERFAIKNHLNFYSQQ